MVCKLLSDQPKGFLPRNTMTGSALVKSVEYNDFSEE
jgi:hypothetical protein